MTLSECQAACDSRTDSNGRPCVAVEWSDGGNEQLDSTAKSCALAWACDWTESCSGGSVFTRDPADVSIDGSASAASVSHGTASEDGISSSEWSDSSLVVIAVGICIGLFVVSVLIALTVFKKRKERKEASKAIEAIHVPDESVQQESVSPESIQKEMAVTEPVATGHIVEISMTAVSSEATNDVQEEAV